MELEAKTGLLDIQWACGHILAFATDRTFTEYRSDVMLRSAVERQFSESAKPEATIRSTLAMLDIVRPSADGSV